MNKIANVDLIYAGNTLVFEGNVVSVEDDKGETVAQTVIRPQDKNDAKTSRQTGSYKSSRRKSTRNAQLLVSHKPIKQRIHQVQQLGQTLSVSGSNNNQNGTVGSETWDNSPFE